METLLNFTSNLSVQTQKITPSRTCGSLQFSSKFKSFSSVSFKSDGFYPLLNNRVLKNRVLKCVSSNEGLETGFDDGIKRKNLAIFVSGGGSNFRAVHQATVKGHVHGQFVVLVTNKHDCGGANYARENGIPVIIYPSTKGKPEGLSSNELVVALRNYNVDFILLAGYLKLIPPELIRAYPNSILNIHPSLLPGFGGKGYYGTKVHKAVIASGARYSGPTIHFVDENYDTGRIVAQRIVPVLANDTVEELAARVLRQEHKVYAEVAAAICEERVIWREDGVPIIQSKANPNVFS